MGTQHFHKYTGEVNSFASVPSSQHFHKHTSAEGSQHLESVHEHSTFSKVYRGSQHFHKCTGVEE
jgi:hypothetical protein